MQYFVYQPGGPNTKPYIVYGKSFYLLHLYTLKFSSQNQKKWQPCQLSNKTKGIDDGTGIKTPGPFLELYEGETVEIVLNNLGPGFLISSLFLSSSKFFVYNHKSCCFRAFSCFGNEERNLLEWCFIDNAVANSFSVWIQILCDCRQARNDVLPRTPRIGTRGSLYWGICRSRDNFSKSICRTIHSGCVPFVHFPRFQNKPWRIC